MWLWLCLGRNFQQSMSEHNHNCLLFFLSPIIDGVLHSVAHVMDVPVLAFTDVLRFKERFVCECRLRKRLCLIQSCDVSMWKSVLLFFIYFLFLKPRNTGERMQLQLLSAQGRSVLCGLHWRCLVIMTISVIFCYQESLSFQCIVHVQRM